MRLYVAFVLVAVLTALFTPIAAVAQSDDRCIGLYDANGARVGGAVQSVDSTTLLINQDGRAIMLRATVDRLEGIRAVFFDDYNCTGNPYFPVDYVQPEANKNWTRDEVWYPDTLAEPVTITPLSQRSFNNNCGGGAGTGSYYPALSLTIPAYTPPYHLEPEPCFTPPDPDPEQIINGCVKNKSGTLRIVADPANCTPRETPISWVGQ
jgi:hypothetical protein